MPRPTPAQLALGTATVVLSTVALLLLAGAQSMLAVALVSTGGLVLGTLVAATASVQRRSHAVRRPAQRRVLTVTGDGPEPRARLRQHSLPR